MKQHRYNVLIEWTGNLGKGTLTYRGYSRNHEIKVEGKPNIQASSDPSFRGDPARYNPEELFVASLSQCHMLWFLHLCSEKGIAVTEYIDYAEGIMSEAKDGSGHFTEVILHPEVTLTDPEKANQIDEIHARANQFCFIANSCNFEVKHRGKVKIKAGTG